MRLPATYERQPSPQTIFLNILLHFIRRPLVIQKLFYKNVKMFDKSNCDLIIIVDHKQRNQCLISDIPRRFVDLVKINKDHKQL